jgi:single-stranded-DNA-specific exonuclease
LERNTPAADASRHQDLPLIERLLAARSIGPDDIESFLSPRLSSLHSPSLLHGVEIAAARILEGLRRDERIVIYGDYDVDGVAATAILFHVIKAIEPSAKLETYTPHRLDDGYGLSGEALRQIGAAGAALVISVDCGITARAAAEAAREAGLDLIITDHHNPPAEAADFPQAVALVHPRLRSDSQPPYPCPDLCGAGVAFKLAWRLATLFAGSERVGERLQKVLLDQLPLVALATIADVVPLTGENRTLASFGLKIIKQTANPGLRALIEATRLTDEKIDCEKIGFVLGPHLNACGRMGHAREAVRLLTTANGVEAQAIASSLAELNRDRQRTERAIFDRALALAEDGRMTRDDRRIIILADPSWHPGVVGIVCARLAERFCRPAILFNAGRDMCKGSARSVDGYSISEALVACADLLETHGGHDMAAGLSLCTPNLPEFVERMTAHANEHIATESLTPSLVIDCDGQLDELTPQCIARVGRLSPFGRGNPRPVVLVGDARISGPPRQMGAEGKHLALQITQERQGARRFMRGLWWKRGDLAGSFTPGMSIDLAVEPKINTWNGASSVELEIRDVHLRMPAP